MSRIQLLLERWFPHKLPRHEEITSRLRRLRKGKP